MPQFILLVLLTIFLGSCSRSQPIFSGPYQALKCGRTRKISLPSTFVFHKDNGYLYYFEPLTDTFKPITIRREEDVFFNSMKEISSKIEINFFLANKLVIREIDYLDSEPREKSIVKNTFNLRSLVMDTIYQTRDGKKLRGKKYCVWIDPKLGWFRIKDANLLV